MSLATRCNSCGTTFRVVQDQLKVSEGWVRCGRCSEVFNALQGLFDLERDTVPDGAEDSSDADSTHDREGAPYDEHSAVGRRDWSDESLVEKLDAQLFPPERDESSATPADHVAERDRVEFADARFDAELLTDEAEPSPRGAATPETQDAAVEHAGAPDFMLQAARLERWQSPLARIALSLAAIVLMSTLALQAVHQHRDLLAARWPQAKGVLQAWCGVAKCSIEPARRIEDISVESTALTRAGEADAFRLSVALRNRGSVALALPAVDLSLTDANGQLVARRALHGADFAAASKLLQPGAEAGLQLLLAAPDLRVTGYTVEIFYP